MIYNFCLEIDECESSPCTHGVCIDEINNYLCVCDTAYYGRQCSECKYQCDKDLVRYTKFDTGESILDYLFSCLQLTYLT